MSITTALLQFLWQGLLISLFVSVAMFLLRKSGPNIRYLLCCIALFACAALSGVPVRPFHFIPLVVPVVVAIVAIFARAHPLPTWPADLPATFHLARTIGAADVWREEQIASGVAGGPWSVSAAASRLAVIVARPWSRPASSRRAPSSRSRTTR